MRPMIDHIAALRPRRSRTTAARIALAAALAAPAVGWAAHALAISSLSLSPQDVTTGGSSTGTVTLDPAPAGSVIVQLTSSDPQLATVPSSLTFSRRSIRTFPVQTVSGATGCATISARQGTSARSALLAVAPPRPAADSPVKLSFGASQVGQAVGGTTINASVFLPSATSASAVQLTSSNPTYARVPPSITVPATFTEIGPVVQGSVPIITAATDVTRCVIITATKGSASSQVLVKILSISG